MLSKYKITSQITSKWEFKGDTNSSSQIKYGRKNYSTFSVKNSWNSNFTLTKFTLYILHAVPLLPEHKGADSGKTATSAWLLKMPSIKPSSLAQELGWKAHLNFPSKQLGEFFHNVYVHQIIKYITFLFVNYISTKLKNKYDQDWLIGTATNISH